MHKIIIGHACIPLKGHRVQQFSPASEMQLSEGNSGNPPDFYSGRT
jgi:hypothetical protein